MFLLNWILFSTDAYVHKRYQNFYGNPLYPLAALQISTTAVQSDLCFFRDVLSLQIPMKKQAEQLLLLFYCFVF